MTEPNVLSPDETRTVTDEWVVVWFPPDAAQRERRFKDEGKARTFAATDDIAEWAPLLEHRITTTVVVSELFPLDAMESTR